MSRKKRYTIGLGFLYDYLSERYSSSIFRSVQQTCRENGFNFIGFEGGNSKNATLGIFHEQKNSVINLITECRLDGMILLAEQLSNNVTDPEIRCLRENTARIPVVGIGPLDFARVCVLIENKKCTRDLVRHMYLDHGRRRIAYMSGPDSSHDARERLSAYQSALRELGLAVDETLVCYGDFYSEAVLAVRLLLDERKADFDAIVCANDSMAIFTVRELERRGLRVPADIAVAGFDDIEEGRQLPSPLTTIQQSFPELGRASVEAMGALLAGKTVARKIVLPSRIVIRESCGCRVSDHLDRITAHAPGESKKPAVAPARAVADCAGIIMGRLAALVPELFGIAGVSAAAGEVVRALVAAPTEKSRERFRRCLVLLFTLCFDAEAEESRVDRFTILLFQTAAESGAPGLTGERLADLKQDAFVLAGLIAHESWMEKRERLPPLEKGVLVINEDFAPSHNLEQLREIMDTLLPKLRFKRFACFLYTDHSRRAATVLLTSAARSAKRPVSDGTPFPAKELVPGALFDRFEGEYMVAALYFKKEMLGYMVCDVTGLEYEPGYDALANQISGAIHGASQAKAIQEYTDQLENKVKERTMQLELAHREKTNFFVNIAHETKTPLTLIRNYLDGYIGKHGWTEELRVIKTNFDKLLHTMVEYLDAEKLERGKIVYRHDQAADASLALQNAVVLFREFARQKNIRIDAVVADGISFAIDPDALDRVVNNLLENAVRFTGTGGKIDVSLRRTTRAIELGVKDSGIGLTTEQTAHIFEPYFQAAQTDGPSAGIGMGLSIVKKIIDAVGAEIKVESRPGKGTSFTCLFSLNRPAVGAAIDHKRKAVRHRAVPAQTAFQEDRSNVLFVEDNLELLAYLVEQTERLFNVYAARNGSEALAMLKVIPKPHLIISDILMDSMGGYRFFEEVMKDGQAKDIPFIFLSAVNSQKERIEGLRKGAVDYIPKPFSIDELIAKMESILKVQEALKEKNIVLLGSKMYHILDQLARDGHGNGPDDTAESSNRLFFDYGISRKEIEVISLLRLGLEHKEIASRLVISTNTVRTYIARIYKKCRVNNKIELFARLKTL